MRACGRWRSWRIGCRAGCKWGGSMLQGGIRSSTGWGVACRGVCKSLASRSCHSYLPTILQDARCSIRTQLGRLCTVTHSNRGHPSHGFYYQKMCLYCNELRNYCLGWASSGTTIAMMTSGAASPQLCKQSLDVKETGLSRL